MRHLRVYCLIIIVVSLHVQNVRGNRNDDKLKAEVLPECLACKTLVDSFKNGMTRTARYKFEGGDAAWEEAKQKKYAESEVRLTEIEEDICKDVVKGQNQCHQLASEYEELFEKWWLHEQKANPDLYEWLCIETKKVCCPENTFGTECSPCPGGIEMPCGGKGKCRGAGTRKGSGECRCNRGYTGVECNECSTGFYKEENDDDENVFRCAECHKSCKGHCRDGTSKGCEICADGWLNHPEFGCQDIDECHGGSVVCKEDQFCVNVEGSYQCIDCFISCASCTGDGPDECIECKRGYTRRDNLCIDSNEWWRQVKTQWGRYITYGGLCLATCIIFKKSVSIASVIGLAVAVYIGMSEYVLQSGSSSPFPEFKFIPDSEAQ